MFEAIDYYGGWAAAKLGTTQYLQQRDASYSALPPLVIQGQSRSYAGERFVAWDIAKQIGAPTFTYRQEVGDCVGNGWAQALNYLQCIEIVAGDWEQYRHIHPSYAYGTSREYGNINGDGSLGSWMARAGKEKGNLPMDEEAFAAGVPKYSGSLSRRWGARGNTIPISMRNLAMPQLVQQVAPIRTWDELKAAVLGAKSTVTIASMMGFSMRLRFDSNTNKHWFTGSQSWAHQMCVIGLDDHSRRPGCFVLNSWGANAHGPQADGPAGGGWVDAEVIERRCLRRGECYALSAFQGFVERELDYHTIVRGRHESVAN